MADTPQNNLNITKRGRLTQAATMFVALFCALLLSAQQRFTPNEAARSSVVARPADLSTPVLLDLPTVLETHPAPLATEPTLLDLAIEFIEPFEGRRHRAYRDSRGHLTIGVGFNLDRAGAADDLDKLLPGVGCPALRRGDAVLTDTQIDVLLRHDVQRALDTARRQVTGFDALPIDAQLIVIDMTFNTGSLHKWRKFRSALARRDYIAAADAMHRSLWRRQTGQRAEGLIERMVELAEE